MKLFIYSVFSVAFSLTAFAFYYLGSNDGYDLGVKVGHAEEIMHRSGCFYHNGVRQ